MSTEQPYVSLSLPQTLPIDVDHDNMTWEYLSRSPNMFKLYLKVLRSRPGLKEGQMVPKFGVESTMKISKKWLSTYTNVCGWTSTDKSIVPITAPQVLAAPLHMYLLTRMSCFRVRLWG